MRADGSNFKPRIAMEIMTIPDIILYAAHFLLVLGDLSGKMAADRYLLGHLPDILCLLRTVHIITNFISIMLIDEHIVKC